MNSLKWSLIGIGATCAGIGCYGAFEQSAASNGGYLMIAAPVVALASAIVPYFAEQAWAAGHKVKGVLLALVLIPAAATVFYAAAERVHLAKAGAEAERASMRSAVTRSESALDEAKASVAKAEMDAKVWRSKSARACDPICVAKWDAAASAARSRMSTAAEAVTLVGAKAAEESPLKAPVWLLPLALDLVAFISIWTGLSLSTPERAPAPQPNPVQHPVQDRAITAKKSTKRRKPVKRRQALGRGFAVIHGGKL